MKIDLSQLVTETRNQNSENIDAVSTKEILQIINNEDKQVPLAVEKVLPQITQAVDAIALAFANKGRLIYVGAGTSGRLGILDASECPPTYGTPASQVIGLIAGGKEAILKAVENAEDKPELGEKDLIDINFNHKDILVGIAASGRTPYVIGAMAYAKTQQATVISISCNPNSPMSEYSQISITPIVGPEVVTGSSRMKAGTAQKLILNMLTTGAMIRSGKVYSNLMVDVEATNAKLIERQKTIVMSATGCTKEVATQSLQACQGHCKTAIVMILTNSSASQAQSYLKQANGFTRQAIEYSLSQNHLSSSKNK